ncbi:hypothetical protein KE540_14535 [Lachnospiraceae bacterium Marseille-Q4251]|nr:hypothetical protein [Lachnospiraceae bacterium Marseille-Q4251]
MRISSVARRMWPTQGMAGERGRRRKRRRGRPDLGHAVKNCMTVIVFTMER